MSPARDAYNEQKIKIAKVKNKKIKNYASEQGRNAAVSARILKRLTEVKELNVAHCISLTKRHREQSIEHIDRSRA